MNATTIKEALKSCPPAPEPKPGQHRGWLEGRQFLCNQCAIRLCRDHRAHLVGGGTMDFPTGAACIGCGKVDA